MSISGLRFGHVAFKVADTERSVRWYSDSFGCEKDLPRGSTGRPARAHIFGIFQGTMRRAFHGGQKPVAFASRPDRLHPLLFDRQ